VRATGLAWTSTDKGLALTHLDLLTGYRASLLDQRTVLLAQIAQQRGGTRSRAEVAEEHFAHSEDAPAQVASERDIEFALNEHETAQLDHIAKALERLERGTYGACTDCGTTIAAERLRATPQAQRCMACQEKTEHPSRLFHA